MVNQLRLGDISVDVVLKDIKNVHLSVYPPTGRVRISAPHRMKLGTIRRLRDFQTELDQAAANEAARTRTRNAARVLGPREPLRMGKALLAETH